MENMYARFKNNFRSSKNGRYLQPGDKVFAYKPDLKAGKLACNYFGPLNVVRRCYDNSYELRCCSTGKIYRRNLKHLRRLTSRDEIKIGHDVECEGSKDKMKGESNYIRNDLDFIQTDYWYNETKSITMDATIVKPLRLSTQPLKTFQATD